MSYIVARNASQHKSIKQIASESHVCFEHARRVIHKNNLPFLRVYKKLSDEEKKQIKSLANIDLPAKTLSKKVGVSYYKTKKYLCENNLPFKK